MIERLRLINYRCFKDHTVPLRAVTVVIGPNNAGKSTIVEALRLIALVARRVPALSFRHAPKWTGLHSTVTGLKPSLRYEDINFDTVCHRYGSPPAKIEAKFAGGAHLSVFVHPEEGLFATVHRRGGARVASGGAASRLGIPALSVLSHVGPLLKSEDLLVDRDYVLSAVDSYLAPRHFRNQLFRLPEYVVGFKQLAESTWAGLEVRDLERQGSVGHETLSLYVRDGDFVAEVGWMGHGLQMWLQTMWFLSRCPGDAVVVLDEPDIYMHADLQHKLVSLVRTRFRQAIIATHSVEVMSDVEPESVLLVDRTKRQSQLVGSMPELQELVDTIGTLHNVQLARVMAAKKCLMVEGKDAQLLGILHERMFPNGELPLKMTPNWPIGGWGGWSLASEWARRFHQSVDHLAIYCVLDRDYHTREDIASRLAEARSRSVYLHVWSRKEIENYLVVPEAIVRAILGDPHKAGGTPDVEIVSKAIDEISDGLRRTTFDAISDDYARHHRCGVTEANRAAREALDAKWEELEDRLAVVSGKRLVSGLSAWSQREYGVTLSSRKLAWNLAASEIPEEMAAVVSAIETGRPFPSNGRKTSKKRAT